MSDYILTYTKTKFYPLKPVADDIFIEDIAHALSLMTRANGHFKHFYSVAQHAINCYKEAKSRSYSNRVQLGCLMHDASESYISDLTRPVKGQLPEYFAIEEKLQGLIYEKYGLGDLTEEEKFQIKDIDDALLYYEFIELMGIPLFDTPPEMHMEHDYSQRDFLNVQSEFIFIFNKLTHGQKDFSCVGIDGCRSGWVAVNITDNGFEVEMYKSIEEICSKFADSDCLLVDMPIGLAENSKDIRPDSEARTYLSGRTSCIFNTPCRQAVYEEDYFEASQINKSYLGKGLSKQSFAICGQIRQIDEFLGKNPEYKGKLRESHPEVCFAVLASKDDIYLPLYNSKHTENSLRCKFNLSYAITYRSKIVIFTACIRFWILLKYYR
jgi:predicted RNase H-like nuclease